jgi:hypothetical protein
MKILLIELEKTEAKNDCAGEARKQFNRLNEPGDSSGNLRKRNVRR